MCNCIKETEKRFEEYLKENDPRFKDAEGLSVAFENRALMVESGRTELVIPMEYEWQHTAKSGRVSTKRKVQNFIMQYCPFCGEKLRG